MKHVFCFFLGFLPTGWCATMMSRFCARRVCSTILGVTLLGSPCLLLSCRAGFVPAVGLQSTWPPLSNFGLVFGRIDASFLLLLFLTCYRIPDTNVFSSTIVWWWWWWCFLCQLRDPTTLAVLLEDGAACLGVMMAMGGIG